MARERGTVVDDLVASWGRKAFLLLQGKKVRSAFYTQHSETGRYGLAITFVGGPTIFVMSDDEGNDAGSVFTSDKSVPVLPKI